MGEQTGLSYQFGRFSVDTADRVLRRDKEPVPLTPKAFDILLTLVENSGRIVEKDDLMKRVWPNTFVEEGNLTQNVSLLRKALGESANGPQFIETVPRRGYRFIATIAQGSNDGSGAQKSVTPGDFSSALSPANVQAVEVPPHAVLNSFPVTADPSLPFLARFRNRLPTFGFTLAAVLLVIAGLTYFSGRGKATEGGSIQSIAVLPFVDDSPDADAE